MSSLFVIRGNDQGRRIDLDQRSLTLGRDASNSLQLHDTEVSRHHAEISWSEGGHFVADLQSSNGTFVNGQQISRQKLASGDHVQLGSTLLLYTGPAEEPEENLAGTVAIASPQLIGDRSQIVHAMPQEEGSRLLDFSTPLPQSSWLARARSSLQVIYHTALAASRTQDIDQLLQRILELIFQWVEADRGCIMLRHPETRKLEPKARRTRQGADAQETITLSQTILDYVFERNEGVLTSNAQQDARWESAGSIIQTGVREAICVPMQGRYGVVGVIYIDTSLSPHQALLQAGRPKFNQEHLKLLIAIAHQAALAVEDTRYYSAMVQAERLAAIGQTIATLSHHIKNILQGIRGGSYLIEMGLTQHDEAVIGKGWKIVEKNQQKISAMVMDMLTFSKEREPELLPGDLNQLVGDVMELSQSRAAECGVRLSWRPIPELPTLVFDPDAMHRAVLNVVSNAIDAVAEVDRAGEVHVSIEHDSTAGLLRVIVDDNGPGIPADQMATLFSPFVSTKKSRGTGLGLPVSRKILQEHGGDIQVESTLGEGSRFVLQFPAVPPPELPDNRQTLTSLPPT